METARMRKTGIGLRLSYPMPVSCEEYPLFAEFNDAICDAIRLYALEIHKADPSATVVLDYRCENDGDCDRFVYTISCRRGTLLLGKKVLTFLWSDGILVKRKNDDFLIS